MRFQVYEKEINLLKQVETLHKTQEDNKVLEVANTIQIKLNQKKTKIDNLKAKLSTTEAIINNMNKVIYYSIINLITIEY